MNTAYHSSADGQVEKSNQTVETTLRSLLIDKYEKKWEKILPQMEYSLNVFRYASSQFEILYGLKLKDSLLAIIRKDKSKGRIDFFKEKRQIRLDTVDAIKIAQAMMVV